MKFHPSPLHILPSLDKPEIELQTFWLIRLRCLCCHWTCRWLHSSTNTFDEWTTSRPITGWCWSTLSGIWRGFAFVYLRRTLSQEIVRAAKSCTIVICESLESNDFIVRLLRISVLQSMIERTSGSELSTWIFICAMLLIRPFSLLA